MLIDDPDIVAEISAAHSRYESARALDDRASLNEMFWNDERAIRIGPREQLYGFGDIGSWRLSSLYTSGSKDEERLQPKISTFGRDCGTTVLEFTNAAEEHVRQTQVWIRTPDGWRIASAHVSIRLDEPDHRLQ